MKKHKFYGFVIGINLTGGFCFLLAAIFAENNISKYGFLLAALCLIVSGLGFLYTRVRNK